MQRYARNARQPCWQGCAREVRGRGRAGGRAGSPHAAVRIAAYAGNSQKSGVTLTPPSPAQCVRAQCRAQIRRMPRLRLTSVRLARCPNRCVHCRARTISETACAGGAKRGKGAAQSAWGTVLSRYGNARQRAPLRRSKRVLWRVYTRSSRMRSVTGTYGVVKRASRQLQ